MTFSNKIAELKNKGFFENLVITRGIEKESLRVTEDGFLSQTKHPQPVHVFHRLHTSPGIARLPNPHPTELGPFHLGTRQ